MRATAAVLAAAAAAVFAAAVAVVAVAVVAVAAAAVRSFQHLALWSASESGEHLILKPAPQTRSCLVVVVALPSQRASFHRWKPEAYLAGDPGAVVPASAGAVQFGSEASSFGSGWRWSWALSHLQSCAVFLPGSLQAQQSVCKT